MPELVAFQFIQSSAKFLLLNSMDDGTFGNFGYVLSCFGFIVETDVVINNELLRFGFSGRAT
jgi:hypothetical protein